MLELQLKKLVTFRKELHRNAELSEYETLTAKLVKQFIHGYAPDEIMENIGGHGMAFIYNGEENGPTVMFRSELDALPISEINIFSHQSKNAAVSHKCGHDGHMAILAGLASAIHNNRPTKGKVVLLYQPAEETGKGAEMILDDPKFKRIEPDYIYALHNLPGFPINEVLVKDGAFSSASVGLIVRIFGKTSHAAEPEKGNNPAFVMSNILLKFETFAKPLKNDPAIKIITPIYAKLGEKAFGTSAGFVELMFTLRATLDEDFESLKEYVLKNIDNEISKHNMLVEYEWTEEFPNTVNNHNCTSMVKEAAKLAQYKTQTLDIPFRWSEDFGHFLSKYPGAIFGLGSGIHHPALHNPDYDFPDELIETGIQLFYNIYQRIFK